MSNAVELSAAGNHVVLGAVWAVVPSGLNLSRSLQEVEGSGAVSAAVAVVDLATVVVEALGTGVAEAFAAGAGALVEVGDVALATEAAAAGSRAIEAMAIGQAVVVGSAGTVVGSATEVAAAAVFEAATTASEEAEAEEGLEVKATADSEGKAMEVSGVAEVAASVTVEGVVSPTTNPTGMVLLLQVQVDLGVRLGAEAMGHQQETGFQAEVRTAETLSAMDLRVGTMTGKRNGQGIEGISGFLVRSFRFHAKVTVYVFGSSIWWVQVRALVWIVRQSCKYVVWKFKTCPGYLRPRRRPALSVFSRGRLDGPCFVRRAGLLLVSFDAGKDCQLLF
ncbi:hypothetical protein DFH06DRAFT_646638 [Mycena polygramma]|nr:hypothetical protein DFH06DRAFT_646638 [Mycena polygramma]